MMNSLDDDQRATFESHLEAARRGEKQTPEMDPGLAGVLAYMPRVGGTRG